MRKAFVYHSCQYIYWPPTEVGPTSEVQYHNLMSHILIFRNYIINPKKKTILFSSNILILTASTSHIHACRIRKFRNTQKPSPQDFWKDSIKYLTNQLFLSIFSQPACVFMFIEWHLRVMITQYGSAKAIAPHNWSR